MDNTCIPFVLINDRKMIDAKHVHKLLECKYDFKHWIKDVISSFDFTQILNFPYLTFEALYYKLNKNKNRVTKFNFI